MSIEITIQYATEANKLPGEKSIKKWVTSSLDDKTESAEITVRIVDEPEGQQLNKKWRNVDGPTNVLSFPYHEPDKVPLFIQGDIVLCAPVIIREAEKYKKQTEAYWAHMVIHGMLHLQGYDHVKDNDATEMESLETTILEGLNYPDPYITQH